MSHAIILEPNDLDRLINSLREEIRLGFEKSRSANNDPPLTRKQAAKYLGISERTFDKRFKEGYYPCKLMHGEGRKKSFFASELENFLKRQ